VAILLKRLEVYVNGDKKHTAFNAELEKDISEKLEVPGGASLLTTVGKSLILCIMDVFVTLIVFLIDFRLLLPTRSEEKLVSILGGRRSFCRGKRASTHDQGGGESEHRCRRDATRDTRTSKSL